MEGAVWATESESEQEFQARMDRQWEEWWNSMPHSFRFPTDNDPED